MQLKHPTSNKGGNVRITWQWGVFVPPLLQWNSNTYYMFWVRICSLRHPECNAHAPYCHLWPAPLYNIFFTLSHKRHDFQGKKMSEHKMCVLISSITFVWNISHSKRIERDMLKNIYWYSCKVPVLLLRLQRNLNFLDKYSQNIQMQNFTKIRQMGADLLPCGQTWRS